MQSAEGIQEPVIMYEGGEWSCEVRKRNVVLYKGLYDYIIVFNEYYKISVNVHTVFVKKSKLLSCYIN
jgi:hypothetical protein